MKRSLPSRPPDIDTTTDSSCTPAMLSAMSMAWRTISSASTRSTTEPAFMPLAAVWANAKMRTPWLRRRSTSCGACGSSRAIRQTILLVPMSRPATTAARRGETGFIFGVRPKRSTVMPRLPLPDLAFLAFSASLSACSRAAAAASD